MEFFRPDENTLLVILKGDWKAGNNPPSYREVQREIGAFPRIKRLEFGTSGLRKWDSGFLTFLMHVIDFYSKSNIAVEKEGLPKGVQKLLSMAAAVPERKGTRKGTGKTSFFERAGNSAIAFWRSEMGTLSFIGDATIAFSNFIRKKAKFRRSDLFLIMQECGAQALPIVSLISFLVGLILAFVGAIQLKMFGAQIYVANLVGFAMVRVLGAVMTGIIMAGRTGASFAAQLGTMGVNEEIDALKTLGLSPMEFLVLPRMLALFLMMPLLSLYADLVGTLGGFAVGVGLLDLSALEYYNQTKQAVRLNDIWIGLFHSAVFGIIIAITACMKGMQSGRSASAVGDATTSAVVTSIVSIVVATAIITVICNVLGI